MGKVSRTKYLGNEGGDYWAGLNDDYVYGGSGNDVIHGEDGNDFLYGGLGNDTLMGEDGNDWLNGGNGDDRIDGGAGNNKLLGGYGADTFVLKDFHLITFGPFQPAVNTISDFVSGVDKIEVGTYVIGFVNPQPIPIDPTEFVKGTAALDSNDHYIYDRNTGNLYFDFDGQGGDAQILIATLLGKPDLKSTDILSDYYPI